MLTVSYNNFGGRENWGDTDPSNEPGTLKASPAWTVKQAKEGSCGVHRAQCMESAYAGAVAAAAALVPGLRGLCCLPVGSVQAHELNS